MKNKLVGGLLLAALLGCALAARAQDYPTKPIRVIVPAEAGGTTDVMARTVAEMLREKWGQTVIVENRGGAGGNIGAEMVSRAAPDGYTLLLSAPGPLAINKSLYNKLAYDSDAFVPISVVSTSNSVLIVRPDLGVDSVQQLIAFAKANPARLNYASSGDGSTPHLAAELFKAMAGVKIEHVPYKGSGPALLALVAGHVDITFVELSLALPHIRSGKARVLAIGSEKRKSFMPDVPTVSEALPGFISVTWFGLVAPPKTPAAIANHLSTAIADALKQPEVAKRLAGLNIDAGGSTPAEMTQFMKQESERWGSLIRATGMTVK
jgi:tripartite-type tricarboxylate transporter receptor subunit TctC